MIVYRKLVLLSKYLNRNVIYDLIIPNNFNESTPILFLNDGQDFEQLKIEEIILNRENAYKTDFIYAGIHTSEKRLYEYGCIDFPDYKGRGNLANEYNKFLQEEFFRILEQNHHISLKNRQKYIAGFSLGGLSAFDIAWEFPDVFTKVGVFSGSFWWRNKSYTEGFTEDADRIMHQKVKNSTADKALSVWLECGTKDEKEDRNKNGIIDSIDDTIDLISEMKQKGIKDIEYLEIPDGEHNFNTWSRAFPIFLDWLL